jgi:hypothetical protein
MKKIKKFFKKKSRKKVLFSAAASVGVLFGLSSVSFGIDFGGEVLFNGTGKSPVPRSIVPAPSKNFVPQKSMTSSTSLATTIAKLSEGGENVLAAVESIRGYALKNKKLPDLSKFTSVVRNPNDSWGKPLVYIYDANLATNDVCSASGTSLTIRFCNDASCSSYTDIQNVAFMILSGGQNHNIQTAGSQGVSSSTIIKVYKQEVGPVDNYPNDVNRPEPYDDIVNYVTLAQLKSGIACFIPGVSPITIVNNSGQTWSTSKGNLSPGQKITMSPNEVVSIGGNNYSYTSLSSIDTNKNGIVQISGSNQQTIYIPSCYSKLVSCYLDIATHICRYTCQNTWDFRTCVLDYCYDYHDGSYWDPIKPNTCDGVRDWFIQTYYPDGMKVFTSGSLYFIAYLTTVSYPQPIYSTSCDYIPQTVSVPVITDQ